MTNMTNDEKMKKVRSELRGVNSELLDLTAYDFNEQLEKEYTFYCGKDLGLLQAKRITFQEHLNFLEMCSNFDNSDGFLSLRCFESYRNKHGLCERLLDYDYGQHQTDDYVSVLHLMDIVMDFYNVEIKQFKKIAKANKKMREYSRYSTFYDGQFDGFIEGKLETLQLLRKEYME